MEENKYAVAGWLAVALAVLYPLMAVGLVVDSVLKARVLRDGGFMFGFGDMLMFVCTGIQAYLLLMFRRLIRERYGNHELDVLILISVGCMIVFTVVGTALALFLGVFAPGKHVLSLIVYLAFAVAVIVISGIVDTLIGIKLLRVKESLGEYVRVFGYVMLAIGICEISVLLSPFAFLMDPVSAIVLALVFFRDQREVEFV